MIPKFDRTPYLGLLAGPLATLFNLVTRGEMNLLEGQETQRRIDIDEQPLFCTHSVLRIEVVIPECGRPAGT